MSERKHGKYLHIFAFPVLILYDEVILRLLTGTFRISGWPYIILFSLAFGLFLFGVISLVRTVSGPNTPGSSRTDKSSEGGHSPVRKGVRIFTDIILWCVTVLFAVESVVRSVFTTYMTPENLAFASGNASANYTSQVARSILLGIPKFLAFAAPVILYFLLPKLRNRGNSGSGKVPDSGLSSGGAETLSVSGSESPDASYSRMAEPAGSFRMTLEDSALAIALSLVLTWAVSLAAANGPQKALYGAQFDYNRATETFGLVTSTRLACKYSIFGNQNVSYNVTDFEERSGSADVTGAESGKAGTDSAASGGTGEKNSGSGNTETGGSTSSENTEEKNAEKDGTVSGKTGSEETVSGNVGSDGTASENSGSDGTISGNTGSDGTASGKTGSEETVSGNVGSDGTAPENSGTDGTSSKKAGTDGASSGEKAAAAPILNKMNIDFSKVENTGSSEVDALTSYIEARTPTAANDHTGIFKGKNLILICAESYCSDFISPELTPTLWRLTTKGIYCTEYYQPEWGGSTTTGEASFLLGLAPKDGDQTMNATADNNNYFTMGNQLQRLGYSSCAFHNGSVYYYNRNLTHTNLGYNQFIANENGLRELCGGSYPKDTKCFDKTIDLYLDKQPFSIYYMTASGHAPYESDDYYVRTYYDRVNEVVGNAYKEKTKYYICAQMELENALTLLVNRLEEAGIADDTVIAMVGDHYPYGLGTGEAWGNDQDYINDLIKGDSTIPFEEDRSGLIIWSESLENDLKDMACTIDTPVFSLDVLPTLSNLFGLEFDSRLLPGRDIFSDTEPLVFWNNLSWVTTHGKYDARHKKYYPNDGYTDDPDYRAAIDAEVENRILMSRSIVSTDYYGKIFGPDTVTEAGETIFTGSE